MGSARTCLGGLFAHLNVSDEEGCDQKESGQKHYHRIGWREMEQPNYEVGTQRTAEKTGSRFLEGGEKRSLESRSVHVMSFRV